MRGARRYSAEIVIAPGDRIILDDDSVSNLEVRANCLVPATIYSRVLAARATQPSESQRSGTASRRRAALKPDASINGWGALKRN